MESLEKAVDLVTKWPASRAKDRQHIVGALKDLAAIGERARAVWEEYLKSPGEPGGRWSLITWIGPDRMRRLHEINLEAKAAVKRIADTAGPQAGRFDQLDADFIVLAYRQLEENETGPEAAKRAVEDMNTRVRWAQELAARIQRTPPAKGAGGKKTAKERAAAGAKKKTGTKKSAKKSAKKSK